MEAFQELYASLSSGSSTFACGGDIKIDPTHGDASGEGSCPPVIVRWDGEGINKIKFPQSLESPENGGLAQLLARSEQATFGHGGKDVLDESYRKASKLDNTEFSTNFHPHDYGIIDAIRQTLFSTLVSPASKGEQLDAHRKGFGVIAKLYKLNVYSAPSGKFKPHVDTPRAPEQFGSLVVSLPCPHQGGQLRVAHKGTEIIYDWSNEDSQKIEWAAFFSDCEHEVLEVTRGNRVTLTYNLFMSPFPSSVISASPTMGASPELYPLYRKVQALLEDPKFMANGGRIGFRCTHAYAHANDDLRRTLPYALKGLDAIVYATFKHLKISVRVLPVLEGEVSSGYGHQDEDEDEDEDGYEEDQGVNEFVGTDLHSTLFGDEIEDGRSFDFEFLSDNWPCDRRSITWLNNSGVSSDLALAYMTYGNESTLAWRYSLAALIINVPAHAKRMHKGSGEESGKTPDQYQ